MNEKATRIGLIAGLVLLALALCAGSLVVVGLRSDLAAARERVSIVEAENIGYRSKLNALDERVSRITVDAGAAGTSIERAQVFVRAIKDLGEILRTQNRVPE